MALRVSKRSGHRCRVQRGTCGPPAIGTGTIRHARPRRRRVTGAKLPITEAVPETTAEPLVPARRPMAEGTRGQRRRLPADTPVEAMRLMPVAADTPVVAAVTPAAGVIVRVMLAEGLAPTARNCRPECSEPTTASQSRDSQDETG